MKLLKTILGVLAIFVATSCTKNQTEGSGSVSFALDNNFEIVEQTRSNVSDYTTLPSVGDFNLTIKGVSVMYEWTGKASEWDTTTQLLAGSYTVEAAYGSLEEEGSDKPYFYSGNQPVSFTVVGNETTQVSIPVALGNTIIKVSYSDYFKKYFTDYSFKLTRDNKEIVTFAKDETQAAFIDGYKITVEGTMTVERKTSSYSKEYTNLKEATAYTLAFDVSNVGGATLTVTFNDTVETVELGDIELNE